MTQKTKLYVVSSMREYENCETYFCADGVFPTMEDALTYIRGDIEETIFEENSMGYSDTPVLHEEPTDDYDCELIMNGHRFLWRTDICFCDLALFKEMVAWRNP